MARHAAAHRRPARAPAAPPAPAIDDPVPPHVAAHAGVGHPAATWRCRLRMFCPIPPRDMAVPATRLAELTTATTETLPALSAPLPAVLAFVEAVRCSAGIASVIRGLPRVAAGRKRRRAIDLALPGARPVCRWLEFEPREWDWHKHVKKPATGPRGKSSTDRLMLAFRLIVELRVTVLPLRVTLVVRVI